MRRKMNLTKMERRLVKEYRARLRGLEYDGAADYHQVGMVVAVVKVVGEVEGEDQTRLSTQSSFFVLPEPGLPDELDRVLDVVTVECLESRAAFVREKMPEAFEMAGKARKAARDEQEEVRDA